MRPIDQALAVHRAGDLNQAEALYRQMLAADAGDFDALHMLGIVFAQRQQFEEAEEFIRGAMAIDRKVAPCLHSYGNVLSMLKRYEEAVKIYDEALLLAPFHAPIYSDRGNANRALERLDDAVASYNQALSLNPNFSDALGNLAQVLIDLRRYDEAEALLRRALALNANDPFAVKLMGHLAFERGDLESALIHSRNALALKADQGDAYHTIANALRALGRLDEARDAYLKSIELDPNNAAVHFDLSATRTYSPGDRHLGVMEAMAARPTRLSKLDRIYLGFALGKACADAGDHRRAFEHLAAANTAKRAMVAYDERAMFAFFDRLEQTFSPELVASKSGGGDPSRRPIFIVGMPRSGTTLIEQLLASHPDVHGAGELPALSAIAGSMQIAGSTVGYPACVPALDQSALQRIGAEYVRRITELAPDNRRVTDKMPSNFLYLGLIHLALPNAVIIHSLRDPVDTCISCFAILFKLNEQNYAYDLGELGRYYARYQRLMGHWRRTLPAGRVLEVRYEDVVGDLEGQARRIVAHCGLDWDERCLSFYKTERPIRTASAVQVREPLYKSSVGRGRAYADYLKPLTAELGRSAD